MSPGVPSTSFETVKRERAFRHPNEHGPAVPMLEELVAPHIESFDALFDDSNGPSLIQPAFGEGRPLEGDDVISPGEDQVSD